MNFQASDWEQVGLKSCKYDLISVNDEKKLKASLYNAG